MKTYGVLMLVTATVFLGGFWLAGQRLSTAEDVGESPWSASP